MQDGSLRGTPCGQGKESFLLCPRCGARTPPQSPSPLPVPKTPMIFRKATLKAPEREKVRAQSPLKFSVASASSSVSRMPPPPLVQPLMTPPRAGYFSHCQCPGYRCSSGFRHLRLRKRSGRASFQLRDLGTPRRNPRPQIVAGELRHLVCLLLGVNVRSDWWPVCPGREPLPASG